MTGGAGYIGSHTVVLLLEAGYEVAIVDNFSNSSPEVLQRIEQIAGRKIAFFKADTRDAVSMEQTFSQWQPEAVIHFAGFKAVGESVQKPLLYYRNNVLSTVNVCQAAVGVGVKQFVFSSTATVYGAPAQLPVSESAALNPESPYAQTKLMGETILTDAARAHTGFSVALLRYFNPIGAHSSGDIGEDPKDIPNNLLPYIAQVAVGRRDKLQVFGNDYPTPDGTGVRDYLHVCDLAAGHIAALERSPAGVSVYNLGTGQGHSVLEVIKSFEKASGKTIPYEAVGRRSGDVAEYYADPTKAERELGWRAKKTLDDMCADTWRWQSRNPNGY